MVFHIIFLWIWLSSWSKHSFRRWTKPTAASLAGSGALTAACMTIENRVWGEPTGELLLRVSTVAILPIILAGWLLYRKKEVTGGGQTSKVALLLIAVAVLVLVFTLLSGLFLTKAVRYESHGDAAYENARELSIPVEVTP